MLRALLVCSVACVGCVHGAEGVVRERAATEFSCADYALQVEEVGPDVFRAQGCGKEVIYACQRGVSARRPAHQANTDPDDFSDQGDEAPMVCARRP